MIKISRHWLPIVIVSFFALLAGDLTGRADSIPDGNFESKLQKYDPKAVSAALRYVRNFNMNANFKAMAPALRQQTIAELKGANPSISDSDAGEFADDFIKRALLDNSETLEHLTALMLLEAFDPDEVEAMDDFYASPMGSRILAKTPAYMAKLPYLAEYFQKTIVPEALRQTQAALKAQGKDIKI
ncbi:MULTISPECIES: DUF2059 domain-containing protein [unclassified Mesorhizobium]|uniref:DUF2059 domain-containing protein n=1 Tax=unclassified Mesorhizobium TaxID=325217 RepID=UPI00333BC976